MSKFLAFLFVLTAITTNAYALPLADESTQSYALQIELPSELVSLDYNFEGIVKLDNCSGSLVRYETSKETDQAMVLTNGHCLSLGNGFLKPNEIVYNQATHRSFGLYNSKAVIAGRVDATHVIYGTMTGTDMALYRLKQTYSEIYTAYGVQPLVLDSKKTTPAKPIEILSGYWKRGYACTVDKFVGKILEDAWTFQDSIKYSQPGCETIPGTSGSPIIDSSTRKVVGVNNTGNDDGELCTMNNPCEVDENGEKKAYQGASYGQQTYWVYSCLTENNEINLLKEGCKLHH